MTNRLGRELLEGIDDRELERERVKLEAAEMVALLLEQAGLSRTDLARALGVSPANITKLLRGTNNFTLETLSEVLGVFGRSLHVLHGPPDGAILVSSLEELRRGPVRVAIGGRKPWGMNWDAEDRGIDVDLKLGDTTSQQDALAA